jgi:hypothetical protein
MKMSITSIEKKILHSMKVNRSLMFFFIIRLIVALIEFSLVASNPSRSFVDHIFCGWNEFMTFESSQTSKMLYFF